MRIAVSGLPYGNLGSDDFGSVENITGTDRKSYRKQGSENDNNIASLYTEEN
jgi:hypothetical protein